MDLCPTPFPTCIWWESDSSDVENDPSIPLTGRKCWLGVCGYQECMYWFPSVIPRMDPFVCLPSHPSSKSSLLHFWTFLCCNGLRPSLYGNHSCSCCVLHCRHLFYFFFCPLVLSLLILHCLWCLLVFNADLTSFNIWYYGYSLSVAFLMLLLFSNISSHNSPLTSPMVSFSSPFEAQVLSFNSLCFRLVVIYGSCFRPLLSLQELSILSIDEFL